VIAARPFEDAPTAAEPARPVGPRRARRPGLGTAAAVVVVAVVAAVDPGGRAPFGPVKWAAATTGVLALAAAVLGRRPLRFARTPTAVFAVFTAWAGLTAVGGLDPLYAWIGTPERHAGVLAWVLGLLAFAVGQALRDREGRTVALGAAMAAAVAGAYALAELLGWEPLRLAGVPNRPGGPFGSSAYLGAAMALLAPAAWGLALDRRSGIGARRVALVGGALGTIALVASGARGAWAGALAAAVVSVARRKVPLRHVLLAAAAIAALAVVTGVAGRLPGLVQGDRGGVQGRLDEWRVATHVVADRPLLGTGPEGYRIAFAEAVDADYERAHGRDPLPDRAHSAVLDVAATAGVPGAALYVALLGLLAAAAVKTIRDAEPWRAGVACGVLAFFAQSLVLFPIPELDVVGWLLAGLVVVPHGRAVRLRAGRLSAATAAIVAAVVAVAGLLDVAANRVDADTATRLRPDAVRHHLLAAREDPATALHALRRASRISPLDPVVQRETARVLLERARRSQARAEITAARTALEAMARRDPNNAETQLRLGLARALDGEDASAISAWQRAEHLAPGSAAAPANLAVAHARAGRLDDARRAARRALALDPEERAAAHVLRTIGERHGT
jgi:O-antigen ligase/cytochrome c-type biogenesis protein CcmH/NrfG